MTEARISKRVFVIMKASGTGESGRSIPLRKVVASNRCLTNTGWPKGKVISNAGKISY
jgi:hypothetical protein